MENKSWYKKALTLSDEEFKRLTGVTKILAKEMVEILQSEYAKKHVRYGRKAELLPEDMLMMTHFLWGLESTCNMASLDPGFRHFQSRNSSETS